MPRSRRSFGCRVVAVVGATVVLACCGTSGDRGATGSGGTVTVLAAASLTGVFQELADELAAGGFEPEVVFSFGPSSALVEQVLAGAPADVLATADTPTMAAAVTGGAVSGEPVVFARNGLALVVPQGNPAAVSSLADLARDDLTIALCEPQVPCGAAASRLLASAGVVAAPDTLEIDVRHVAGKVALGEVDAALVYRTDVGAGMERVEVTETAHVLNDYPVAVIEGAADPEAAGMFVAALTSESGRRVLAEAGFEVP